MPDLNDTIVELSRGEAKVRDWTVKRGALFIHIVAWTRGQEASVVPHGGQQLSLVPSGTNWDFATRSGLMMIRDNHCLLMSGFNMRASSMNLYLRTLVQDSIGTRFGLSESDAEFTMLPVENVSALDKLYRDGGVKRIEFDVIAYAQTADALQRPKGIMARVIPFIDALRKDDSRREIEEFAEMNAKLVLSPGRGGYRRKYEVLTDIARKIADDGDEDFMSFRATDGSRVNGRELVLCKTVRVRARGNSLDHEAGWNELYRYFMELDAEGALAT
ncbi:MAG: hypothetical protein OXR82_08900 [Gammaproteobacteria bacterium]|nr:hypothetical protein [Gammaproteobacteria bacterium]MDE0258484.1 hypothetical protein [Gammaproteobacteria bacterium]